MMNEATAEHIVKTYRDNYTQISDFWKSAQETLTAISEDQTRESTGVIQVRGRQGIRLPNGLFLKYPNLRRIQNEAGEFEFIYDSKRGKQSLTTKIYGGKLVENICQAVARCIIGEQIVKVAERYKVVLTVHDAIACIAPEDQAEEAKEYVIDCMKQSPDWAIGLPLNCEAGYAKSYGEC